jgi:hypothetical protein
MNTLTIEIPNNNSYTLIKQLEELHIIKIITTTFDVDDEFEVPEWHKKIVLESIANTKPEEYQDWDIVKV